MSKKPSAAFTKVFLSAPQYNPANSGKGPKGNYKGKKKEVTNESN